MRILAVDPGEKRIGLALSDPTATLATPLQVLHHDSRDTDAARIATIAKERQVELIIVGQSFGDDGQPTPRGRSAARLAAAIRAASDLPVELRDEDSSSTNAHAARRAVGSRGKSAIDAEAAANILQNYLDEHKVK
jgi:putative Holliday junction resolvase